MPSTLDQDPHLTFFWYATRLRFLGRYLRDRAQLKTFTLHVHQEFYDPDYKIPGPHMVWMADTACRSAGKGLTNTFQELCP